MRVQLLTVEYRARRAPTRMPFHFGNAAIEDLEIAYAFVEARVEGRAVPGAAAVVLSPLWFDKDPGRSLSDRRADLLCSLALAREAFLAAPAAPALALHEAAAAAVGESRVAAGLNGLAASLGVALLDAAVVDSVCRATDTSFHRALRQDLLGTGPELAEQLPAALARRIAVRHTVGMADPLTAADLGDPLNDGLPETLEEVLRETGVHYLKLKISADAEASLARLADVAGLLRPLGREVRVTLDANEQFPSMADFAAFAEVYESHPLRPRTLFFEQPVHRERALLPEVREVLSQLPGGIPVVLDESDAADDSFQRALQLGYRGVSAKLCKGIFRALKNFRLVAERNRVAPGSALLSAEDLTMPPIAALHQDLVLAQALGQGHCERNGHHYLRGLDHLPPVERERALREFPRLYERRGELVRVRIADGMLDLVDLGAGTGCGSLPDLESMESLDAL